MPACIRSIRFALVLAAVAACGSSGKKIPAGGGGDHPAANVKKVSLADVGLESASRDLTAAPCDDFYQYACGGWIAANPIPADRARWGRLSELNERNEAEVWSVLEELAAKPPADPIEQKLGDYYGACMDDAAVEKRGTDGIQPLLAAIDKVKDARTLLAAIIALHRVRVPAVWGTYVTADLTDSTTNILYLDTDGLGLPDRDYYTKDDFAAQRTAYVEHLTRLYGLVGKGKASAAMAKDVMALETKLADKTKTGVERRDLPTMYNPTDAAGLARTAPGVDWAAYFQALGNPAPGKLALTTPAFFEALSDLITSTRPEVWRAYLTARVLDDAALALPTRFADETFKLEQALTGVEKQRDRWKRCVEATTDAMSEYLGQAYVKRYFAGASKTDAEKLVGAIIGVMDRQLGTLPWMSEATRIQARGKLAKVEAMIGYPDKWKTYDFALDRKDFAGNLLRAREFNAHRDFVKAGTLYDRREWLMPTYIINAYYNPSANNSAFPAGILQAPFYQADHAVAVNLGGIGMVAGHELTHGFDDQGAQFDAAGNLHDWWQPDDLAQFKARGTCLADQFSTFEVLPGKHVNGQLTLGEDIADLGGIKHAFLAYRTLRAGAGEQVVADGLTEDQQFFLAVGQAWCSSDRPEEAQKRLVGDVHAPPRWRVNGALRNLPQFAEAFGCQRGQAMAPAETCTIW